MIKWLSLPVAEYLRLGRPCQDYTQDADRFTRSVQGDIDIGKHFNNFQVHPEDQDSMGVRYIYTNTVDRDPEESEER